MIQKLNLKVSKNIITLVIFSAFFINLKFEEEKAIYIDDDVKYYDFVNQNQTNYTKVSIDVSDIKHKNKAFSFVFNKNDSFFKKLILNKNLIELKIAFTELDESENLIYGLKKIKKLELISCKLKKINSRIKNLTQLEYLDLFASKIKKIENLEHCKNLKVLLLNNNLIYEFSKKSLNLVNLKHLYLENNKICALPLFFEQLKSLSTLRLDNNMIDSIPLNFSKIEKLSTLSLSDNKMKGIPYFLSKNNKDEFYYFNFSNNQIKTIPCFISNYKHLEINLKENHVDFLPECFCKKFDYLYIELNSNCKIPLCLKSYKTRKEWRIDVNSNSYY